MILSDYLGPFLRDMLLSDRILHQPIVSITGYNAGFKQYAKRTARALVRKTKKERDAEVVKQSNIQMAQAANGFAYIRQMLAQTEFNELLLSMRLLQQSRISSQIIKNLQHSVAVTEHSVIPFGDVVTELLQHLQSNLESLDQLLLKFEGLIKSLQTFVIRLAQFTENKTKTLGDLTRELVDVIDQTLVATTGSKRIFGKDDLLRIFSLPTETLISLDRAAVESIINNTDENPATHMTAALRNLFPYTAGIALQYEPTQYDQLLSNLGQWLISQQYVVQDLQSIGSTELRTQISNMLRPTPSPALKVAQEKLQAAYAAARGSQENMRDEEHKLLQDIDSAHKLIDAIELTQQNFHQAHEQIQCLVSSPQLRDHPLVQQVIKRLNSVLANLNHRIAEPTTAAVMTWLRNKPRPAFAPSNNTVAQQEQIKRAQLAEEERKEKRAGKTDATKRFAT